jgi:hypothetical protein
MGLMKTIEYLQLRLLQKTGAKTIIGLYLFNEKQTCLSLKQTCITMSGHLSTEESFI